MTVWAREKRGWKPTALKWAGSDTGVTFSPDGRFVLSIMQENALHGWRLRDKADLCMSGYPPRVKGWACAGDLPWLTTSGADQAILWSYDGIKGPMGRSPLHLCWSVPSLVTAVAAVPRHEIVLAGFAPGQSVFSELADALATSPAPEFLNVREVASCELNRLLKKCWRTSTWGWKSENSSWNGPKRTDYWPDCVRSGTISTAAQVQNPFSAAC